LIAHDSIPYVDPHGLWKDDLAREPAEQTGAAFAGRGGGRRDQIK
jgi:hypothetical protein